jgi:hypothetical protein
MANPTTNYGFVMPTSTDLVTDLPADFDVFGQAVDTQMLTNANAAIAKTIVDAKGDIIAATAADTVSRLAVGANNTVLTADSTAATGIKWAAASSGAMTLIKRATFSSVADTGTTFDSIFSSTYGSYYIVFESVSAATTANNFYLQFRYAGPTTQTAGYTFNRITVTDLNSTITNNVSSGVGQLIMNADIGSSGSDSSKGFLNLYGINGTSADRPTFSGFMSHNNTAAFSSTVGYCTAARVYTGMLCKASSSNISGTISIYGLAVA